VKPKQHVDARHETLFREVNERIRDITHGDAEAMMEVLCECGRGECLTQLEVSVSAYESVRAHGERFLVAPDHQDSALERVVERTSAYLVVEKVGESAEVARRADPRSIGRPGRPLPTA
jgi:hypothetical protein